MTAAFVCVYLGSVALTLGYGLWYLYRYTPTHPAPEPEPQVQWQVIVRDQHGRATGLAVGATRKELLEDVLQELTLQGQPMVDQDRARGQCKHARAWAVSEIIRVQTALAVEEWERERAKEKG